MIKIIFEVSEDFIRNAANPESLKAKIDGVSKDGAMNSLLTTIAATMLKNCIDKGQTEFQVNTETLTKSGQTLFGNISAEVFALAASETKKVDSETELKDE